MWGHSWQAWEQSPGPGPEGRASAFSPHQHLPGSNIPPDIPIMLCRVSPASRFAYFLLPAMSSHPLSLVKTNVLVTDYLLCEVFFKSSSSFINTSTRPTPLPCMHCVMNIQSPASFNKWLHGGGQRYGGHNLYPCGIPNNLGGGFKKMHRTWSTISHWGFLRTGLAPWGHRKPEKGSLDSFFSYFGTGDSLTLWNLELLNTFTAVLMTQKTNQFNRNYVHWLLVIRISWYNFTAQRSYPG